MRQARALTGLIVCASLTWATPATADPVVDWNAIASDAVLTAIAAGERPGPTAVLDFAMVHAAIHDAVQAIEKRFEPYHVQIPGASGSLVAATAKAAHDVLVQRFPTQTADLDAKYHAYLASHWVAETDPGVFAGQQAAAGIIALRANDGSFPMPPPVFIGGTGPGEWRPTLPAFAPMAAPWLGAVEPFTMKFSEQFRPEPPPALITGEYANAYNEVKSLGSKTSTTRTPEQTDLGYFYADNLLILWERTLRGIATDQITQIGDSARLFALANLAAADAIITAWDSKRFYFFWRPITAIQEGDNDGNPRTAGDPAWMPLIATPPYPDYTSGANNLAAAMTHILSLFFVTDKMTFSITSLYPLAVQKTRTYNRFSDVADDMVEVRIYEGIHFRFADTIARRQGSLVAKEAFHHFLRPLHD
jgi:hypothetical protein